MRRWGMEWAKQRITTSKEAKRGRNHRRWMGTEPAATAFTRERKIKGSHQKNT
jgi:hypothetical protein